MGYGNAGGKRISVGLDMAVRAESEADVECRFELEQLNIRP
jgi:hypothetical protein